MLSDDTFNSWIGGSQCAAKFIASTAFLVPSYEVLVQKQSGAVSQG